MGRGPQTTIAIGVDAKRANAELRGLTGEFQKSAQNIKQGFGDRLSGALGRIHPELGRLGSTLGKAGPIALGLTAIAAATVGVVAAFDQWSDGIDRVAKQSQRLGVTETTLIGLRHAAEKSGVSMNQVEMALTKLQKRTIMAAEGNKELARGFEAAGINLDRFQQLSPSAKMDRLAEAFRDIEDPSERVRRAMQLLGDEAGVAMVTMLDSGAESFAEARRQAIAFGADLDGKTAKQVQNYRDSLSDAGLAMRGMANRFMKALAPAMEQFGKLIAWTTSVLNAMLKPFSDALSWLISWDREASGLNETQRRMSETFNAKTKVDLEREAELRRQVAKATREQQKALEPFSADQTVARFIAANEWLGSDKYAKQIEEAFQVAISIRQRQAQIRTLQEMSPERILALALEEGVSPEEIKRRNEALQVQLGQDLAVLATRQVELANLATAAVEAATNPSGANAPRRSGRSGGGSGGGGGGETDATPMHGYGQLADRRAAFHAMGQAHAPLAAENDKIKDVLDERRGLFEQAGLDVTNAMGGLYAGMVAAAVQGEAELTSVMASMVGGLLQQIGTFLIQAGTAALAAGLLGDLFPFLKPAAGSAAVGGGAAAAAIAVGTGLVAAGAGISSAASPRGGGGGRATRGTPGAPRAQVPTIGPDFGSGRDGGGQRPIVIQIGGPGSIVGGDGRRIGRDIAGVLRQAGVPVGAS